MQNFGIASHDDDAAKLQALRKMHRADRYAARSRGYVGSQHNAGRLRGLHGVSRTRNLRVRPNEYADLVRLIRDFKPKVLVLRVRADARVRFCHTAELRLTVAVADDPIDVTLARVCLPACSL